MTDAIAVLMPGDMGHAVGRVLAQHGHDVLTCLDGRSERTRGLFEAAGLRDGGDLVRELSRPALHQRRGRRAGRAREYTGAPATKGGKLKYVF